MQIRFLGAAGTVTGSNYLLTDSRYGMIVDMGMFQGSLALEELNNRALTFDPREVHSVFLTHAHLDHCGRMPLLTKYGFSGKIYMTQATKEITEVVLLDAAKIMQHEEEKPILYTEEDVFDLLNMAEIVSYDEEIDLGEVNVTFRDAGHILGSASIEMKNTITSQTLAFSGDLGNSPEDIVKPIEQIKEADLVIMESTYGDREHPKDDPAKMLTSEINIIESSGGALLIPSFSVERTQVLLHRIMHLKKDGHIKPDTPVYLDSPMGIKVTDIYKKFPNLYGEELSKESGSGDPFSFEGLHIIEDKRSSKNITETPGPKIILAGSGMMNGGRILDHAMHFLPLPTTRLLIVGFQAENTMGREIEEGATSVHIYGQEIPVKATVSAIHSMSAHADQRILLNWLNAISNVKKVFLVHGEDGPRQELKELIMKDTSKEVELPKLEDTFTL